MEYDPDSDRVTDRGDVLGELRQSGLLRPGESPGRDPHPRRAGGGRLPLLRLRKRDAADTGRAGGGGSHLWRLRPPDGRWEHLLRGARRVGRRGLRRAVRLRAGPPRPRPVPVRAARRGTSAPLGSAGRRRLRPNALLADHRGHVYVPRLGDPAGVAMTLVEFNPDLARWRSCRSTGPGRPRASRAPGRGRSRWPTGRWSPSPTGGFSTASPRARGTGRPASRRSARSTRKGDANVFSLASPDGRRYLMGLARRPARRGRPLRMARLRPAGEPAGRRPRNDRRRRRPRTGRPRPAGSITRDDAGRFYVGGSYRRDDAARPLLLQVRLPRDAPGRRGK